MRKIKRNAYQNFSIFYSISPKTEESDHTFAKKRMKSVSLISDICSFIKKDSMAGKGVNVRVKDNRLVIDVHVSVTFGTNISAVTASLKHKVRYAVEEATGAEVDSVNIFVDNITE